MTEYLSFSHMGTLAHVIIRALDVVLRQSLRGLFRRSVVTIRHIRLHSSRIQKRRSNRPSHPTEPETRGL